MAMINQMMVHVWNTIIPMIDWFAWKKVQFGMKICLAVPAYQMMY